MSELKSDAEKALDEWPKDFDNTVYNSNWFKAHAPTLRQALQQDHNAERVDVVSLYQEEPYCEPYEMCDDTYAIAYNQAIDDMQSQGYLTPPREGYDNKAAVKDLAAALDAVGNSAVDCAQFNYEMMVKRDFIHKAEKTLKTHAEAIKASQEEGK